MILLLTSERDLTTDYVVRELQKRGIAYFRLNSERLAEALVRFSPEAGGWVIEFSEATLSLSQVRAGYFRRPGAPAVDHSIKASDERRYCEQEWLSILHSLYGAVGDRWLNAPAAIAAAEDKPRQLALAKRLGFRLPETLVTNDPDAAREFIEAGPTVGKTLRAGLLTNEDTGEERVIFTNRLAADDDGSFAASVRSAPIIFQREIEKESDIRVTVVGDVAMAASIQSQTKDETMVDWRRGEHVDLPHARHELPADVVRQCLSITSRLGLRYAAIDFVLDKEGNYWFLEANPNGQWAWIETRTGHPITERLVDALLVIAGGELAA